MTIAMACLPPLAPGGPVRPLRPTKLDGCELHRLGLLPKDLRDDTYPMDPDADAELAERLAIQHEAPAERPSGVQPTLPRFRIWSAEDIWAPLEPPVYLVDGLIQRANLALVVAYGSSLKTWAEVDLLLAVATGGRFLDRYDCGQGTVLAVDWESGDYELRRRIQAVAKGRGIVGPVPGVAFVTMPDLFFNSIDFEPEIEKLATGRTLIALDSLAAGSIDVDENDARFAQGLQICKRVATRTGAAFVVLHHSRKDSAAEEADERQSVRGTGAIFAAADVVLSLRRPKKSEGVEEDAFVVRQTKARGGKRVAPFVLQVRDTPDGGVAVLGTDLPDPDALPVAVVATTNMDRAKRSVLQLLGTTRDLTSANEVQRRIKGVTRQATLDAIRELRERGLLVVHEGRLRLASEVAQ